MVPRSHTAHQEEEAWLLPGQVVRRRPGYHGGGGSQLQIILLEVSGVPGAGLRSIKHQHQHTQVEADATDEISKKW